MKYFSFALLVLSGGCFSPVFGQKINTPKLDSFFNSIEMHNKGMGSIVIAKDGDIAYQKSIGYSVINDDKKTLATEQTRYRVGSITKMFTATMILQLVEDGRLTLSTTLDKYYPSIPNADKITIANLLNMKSGIHNYTSDSTFLRWMNSQKSEDEIVKAIAAAQPDFEPGKKQEYSNSNFVLLGYILEKIYKRPYAEILIEKVTTKAGLKNTYYGGKINVKEHESYSYKFMDKWVISEETNIDNAAGAGGIVSTPGDLVKFIDALFAGKLVNAKSLEQMKTSEGSIYYGMGMLPYHFGKALGYGHNGAIDEFEASLAYFPDNKVAICYCGNGVVYTVNDILLGAMSIYYDSAYTIPAFKDIIVPTETLDKYVGVYSTSKFPLKITVSKQGHTLIAQATGQQPLTLEATEQNVFKFEKAGVELDFDADKKQMILKQGGHTIPFTKE